MDYGSIAIAYLHEKIYLKFILCFHESLESKGVAHKMRPFLMKILIGCQFINDHDSPNLECPPSPSVPVFSFQGAY